MRNSTVAAMILAETYFSDLAQTVPDPVVMNRAVQRLPVGIQNRVYSAQLDTNWVLYHKHAFMIHFNGLSSPLKCAAIEKFATAESNESARLEVT